LVVLAKELVCNLMPRENPRLGKEPAAKDGESKKNDGKPLLSGKGKGDRGREAFARKQEEIGS
jgi:hypothetical protein